MSHREFEAEPVRAVRWMLEIDRLHAELREQKRRQEAINGPGGVG